MTWFHSVKSNVLFHRTNFKNSACGLKPTRTSSKHSRDFRFFSNKWRHAWKLIAHIFYYRWKGDA